MPIDAKTGIFWEQQSGGLCRMHSLNAYFGQARITTELFNKYIGIYDKYLETRFNVKTSSRSFDLVNSDQTNLVAYILKHHGIHLRYYALNTLFHKPIDSEIKAANFFFVYNFGHIWAIRRKGNVYYKVDSLSGVTPFNIACINRIKEIGIMLPVNLRTEFIIQVQKLKQTMHKAQASNKQGLETYLRILHKQKRILDELEIPMGVAISILETNLTLKKDKAVFEKIKKIIDKYNEFLSYFTAGNYNNLGLILKYIPDILIKLCALGP